MTFQVIGSTFASSRWKFAGLLLLAVNLRAQQESSSVPVLSRGNIQAFAFGGFTVGGSFNRISTTEFRAGLTPVNLTTPSSNGSIGGGIDANLTRRLAVEGDVSYVGGSHLIFNQDYIPDQAPLQTIRASINAHSSGILGTAGGQYLLPHSRKGHLVPYLGAGGGILSVSTHLQQSVIGTQPGQSFSGSTRYNYGVGYFAAGTYYYFGERIGLMVEGRGYDGPSLSISGRLSIGMFFEIR